jgi:hypothetical protein
VFYKIAFFCLCITSVFGTEDVYLNTPNLSKDNIIGTNVGIRPFRKSGIRIEAEQIENKLIVHNYGYGGSGLTLSFGGVQEVLEILENQKISSQIVAILGAGVVGLTTAYDLLEKGYQVRIYADEWPPNLTSNVAAGIWSPLLYPKDLPEDKKQLHLRMEKNSEYRFQKSVGDFPEFIGVRLIPSYSFKTAAYQESDRAKEREEIIAHFDNGLLKNGRRVYEIGIDVQVFINDLYLKVKQKGAILKLCHFESKKDILNMEESVIINCTSMGSIKLFNDQEFIPIRGQLVYYNQQKNIDYLYFHNVDNDPNDSNMFFVSIYPWGDRLIVGGVYEHCEKEPVVSQEIIDKIIKNAKDCLSGTLP